MARPVLLIEDNEQNRYLATFLLQQQGYTVVAAHDGASGIDAARKHLPCVIVLDIQLPAMDGYAVARALRRIDALRDIPIVAVTSFAMTGDREKAIAAGCHGYIEKPINPDTFVASINSFALPGHATEAATRIT
ncbi:MAG: response regulator [Rudaea sp.]|nr:response regulator [Rudaea sp.]